MRVLISISDRLLRVSRGWIVLLAAAVFVLFLLVVLPQQAARTDREIGDVGSPDSSFVYTPSDLYRFAEQYGASGRAAYIRARWTFDVVWPLAYLAFLGTTIGWLGKRAFARGSRWQRLNLVPVLGVLFDYAENSATSLVMARYPARTPVVDLLAPAFTVVKWIFVNGSFVVLLAVMVLALWRWRTGTQPVR